VNNVLDLLSANILGPMIDLSFNLYSSFGSDEIYIDYGDSENHLIPISLCKSDLKNYIYFNYFTLISLYLAPIKDFTFPSSQANISSNNNNWFILLNSEFLNDTTLFGFDLFAVKSGNITIQVNINKYLRDVL
jgi:hypothetical protein